MRDASMQNAVDAKAFGAVTSKTIRVSERWKGSGTKSGECVSILPDGTRLPFSVTRSRQTDTRITRITRKTTNFQTVQRNRLLAIAGTIKMGEQD